MKERRKFLTGGKGEEEDIRPAHTMKEKTREPVMLRVQLARFVLPRSEK